MLQSLERRLGLPIAFDPVLNSLRLTDGIEVERMSERTAEGMAEFVHEPGARASSEIIYRMYRNLARTSDQNAILNSGLRYDITVIPPGFFIGERKEYFRTAGHYHPVKPGTAIAYPEVYEVISGRASWLIQRPRPGDSSHIEETYLIEAGPGEKAVIIPGFGHISVNASREPLIMANWINGTFAYEYEPFRLYRGGGYIAIEGAMAGTVEFPPNESYRMVPKLKKLRPQEIPEFGLLRDVPSYGMSRDLEKLDFLSNPERHADLLKVDTCFTSA